MAWFILVLHIIFLSVAESAEGPKLAKPGCQEKCGIVDIPYPFGIGADCSLNEKGFALSCNESDGKIVPFYANVEVFNITLSTAQVRMYNEISWQCYINSTTNDTNSTTWSLSLDTVYRLSNHENSFTVIGCETLTYNEMWDYEGNYYRTGCVSGCYSPESLNDGSCTGNGCCQTSIPSGINYYDIIFNTNYNYSDAYSFDSCTYAAVLATDSFSFRTSYLNNRNVFLSMHNGTVPVVLDWSISNKTCKEAQTDLSNYACVSNNSECFDSRNGPGYFCNCSTGYQGNPYLHNGCQGKKIILSLKYSLLPF
jgi:Wall-associated receptor kinase galacturonan-binding